MTPNDFLSKIRNTTLINEVKAEASRKLTELGIPKIVAPEIEEPKYPEDVTAMGLESLGRLYSEFMGWTAYCKYLFHLKEADVLLAKSMVSQARRLVMQEHGITSTNKKYREIVDTDSTVLQIEFVLTEFEVQKVTLEARLSWFDDCSKALSREITRRQMEADRVTL